MTNTPKDIMQTACMCTTDNEIAAAIYAERLRCRDLCKRVGSPEWSEDTNSGYALAAREIAEGIMLGGATTGLPAEHRAELESLAAGYEASDYAETLLHAALKPHVDAFHAGSRDDFTLRQLRISNDARSAAERSRRSAEAIRAVLRLVTSDGETNQ
ncbi:hypothetical protein [Rhizobium phage RHph_X2_25]|nr:hypothetical protein [Rhizobium phage RHph_X2_25]